PCVQSSPDCAGGSLGYRAGSGYDLATGLGSVDANNLVTLWTTRGVRTTMTLTASAAAVARNEALQLTASVTADNGVIPEGVVNFSYADSPLGSARLIESGGAASATFTVNTAGLTVGNGSFSASYDGSATLNGSGATVTVAISAPSGSSLVVPT